MMASLVTGPAHPTRQVFSIAEVAELFGRRPRTIRSWIARGLLRPVRVGRSVFIPGVQVDALLTGLPIPEHDPDTA